MRVSDIRALDPTFEGTFQKHVKAARFDVVLKRSRDFKALKSDVISLWCLQEGHKRLRPAVGSDLIQALLVEHNFKRALELVEKTDGNTNEPSGVARVVSYFSREESYENQIKSTAANLPDSQFLQRLQSIDDIEMRSTVLNAKALAQQGLSYSIDSVVGKMTHAVLAMQQDRCKMSVKVEVENEERKVLDDALVQFIREINKKSAGWHNS